ncbi:MAG TPA: four helix bundle protein [Lacipirellulaceae bacterium]|nr:four helix bundle protein [Lacipirellulaceae bacterium]
MKDLRNLKVWQTAHALTLAVYRQTRDFPSDEKFAITSQMRRSCASIPANIAEGCVAVGTVSMRGLSTLRSVGVRN